MIYVRDKGRMANNMLQYGHVYAWGREHGLRTLSMRFAYRYPGFSISFTPGHNMFRYLYAKYMGKIGLLPVISWDDPDPTAAEIQEREKRMLARGSKIVEGWNIRYYDLFEKYLSEIKEMFAFTPAVKRSVASFLKSSGINGDEVSLGLHIRRGDYERWQGGEYFYDDATYRIIARELMEEGRRRFPDRRLRLIICTNDQSISHGKYPEGFPEGTVVSRLGAAEDLYMLSECKLLAGPPSTFSLVAAMYNDTPLAWVKNPAAPLEFHQFNYLFRRII